MKATFDAIDHSDYELDFVGGQMTSSVTRQSRLAARWLDIADCKPTNRNRPRPNQEMTRTYVSWRVRGGLGRTGGIRGASPRLFCEAAPRVKSLRLVRRFGAALQAA